MTNYRFRSGLAVLVAVLAGLAGLAAPALARGVVRSPALTPGSTYLALGDSVTFGYVEQQVVPTPNYHDAGSFLGYPEHIARQLKVHVVNASCPGETTGSFIEATAQSNGCENAPGSSVGYRTAYPLHVSYKGSQLAFALHYLRTHHDVRLVSLMIGANDLFVCQETTKDHCVSPSEQAAVLSEISHNVRKIVAAIRRQAHYRGQFAIVNYYSLDYASATDDAVSQALNRAQDSGARPFGVEIANGYGEFEAASRIFGGDVCVAGLITSWGNPRCPTSDVHPSYSGQALLAAALLKAIRL